MGSSATVIDRAGRDDADAIAELRSLWASAAETDHDFVRRIASWLEAEGDRRIIWLARDQKRAIGMVGLCEFWRMPKPGLPDSRWGYVANMFVRDDMRNRGVGSALLAALFAEAAERAYARLLVSPSPASLSFWQRAGFTVPGRSVNDELLLIRHG